MQQMISEESTLLIHLPIQWIESVCFICKTAACGNAVCSLYPKAEVRKRCSRGLQASKLCRSFSYVGLLGGGGSERAFKWRGERYREFRWLSPAWWAVGRGGLQESDLLWCLLKIALRLLAKGLAAEDEGGKSSMEDSPQDSGRWGHQIPEKGKAVQGPWGWLCLLLKWGRVELNRIGWEETWLLLYRLNHLGSIAESWPNLKELISSTKSCKANGGKY